MTQERSLEQWRDLRLALNYIRRMEDETEKFFASGLIDANTTRERLAMCSRSRDNILLEAARPDGAYGKP